MRAPASSEFSVDLDELPRLLDIAPVAARIALRVAGLAIFIPALLLLWFGSAQSSPYDWLLLGACLAVWLVGLMVRSLLVQSAIQLTSGACLLIGAVLLAPPGWTRMDHAYNDRFCDRHRCDIHVPGSHSHSDHPSSSLLDMPPGISSFRLTADKVN